MISRVSHLLFVWIVCVLVIVFPIVLNSESTTASAYTTESTTTTTTSTTTTKLLLHSSLHTSNHAVIVSSSRYWFNYRHTINALSMYQLLKSHGFHDANIVLMLADDYSINPRNAAPNRMFSAGVHNNHNNDNHNNDGPIPSLLFDAQTHIDYRGDDVTVHQLLRVLAGKKKRFSSSNEPVLKTNEWSNILIYLTGHGGDLFFKFQDSEEILASQIARALSDMHERKRYHSILLIADTCQAFTLGDEITAPNVTIVGSSLRGESSYAHHSDAFLGVSVIERYTHALVQFVRGKNLHRLSLKAGLVDPYRFETQGAHVGYKDETSSAKMDHVPMSDFFFNVESAPRRNRKKASALSSASSEQFRLLNQTALFWKSTPPPPRYSLTPSPSPSPTSVCSIREYPNECLGHSRDSIDDNVGMNNDDIIIGRSESWAFHLRRGWWFNYQGMEPSDPLFMAFVAILIGTVVWSCLTTNFPRTKTTKLHTPTETRVS